MEMKANERTITQASFVIYKSTRQLKRNDTLNEQTKISRSTISRSTNRRSPVSGEIDDGLIDSVGFMQPKYNNNLYPAQDARSSHSAFALPHLHATDARSTLR
jgi:hypothetical protein